MVGWKRGSGSMTTGLPWVLPSPNMPTLDTALVYPGMCLLEGTNLSEGRGTTRPFEIFGAPFIHPATLVDHLREFRLPGVVPAALFRADLPEARGHPLRRRPDPCDGPGEVQTLQDRRCDPEGGP